MANINTINVLQCFFPSFGNGACTGQIGKKCFGLTQIGNFIKDAKYSLGSWLKKNTNNCT
jgi:hypothetical protein